MARKDFDPPDSPTSVGWTEAKTIRLAEETPFALEVGGELSPIDVEYETYGELSSLKDNVILVCHALSGDAHVAGWDRLAKETGRTYRDGRPGWWDMMVGPGKPIDTDRYFVICPNNLGSCYGTTGPSSVNPATGKPYGLTFPVVTIGDWTRLQMTLLEQLGIERLYAVIGGSLGGQQVIEWALAYPDRLDKAMVFAASPRLSTQGLGFNAVGRFSIMNDPNFKDGDYYGGPLPEAGLAAARMLAHITYLSDEGMHEKFGRRLQNKERPDFSFGVEFEVESYLGYQGRAFVERFDANSYLYVTRAADYYDAAVQWGDGCLVEACKRIEAEVMVVSFSADWLYPPEEMKEFALGLSRNGKRVNYIDVPSRYGHDAFLVETEPVAHLLRHFLNTERP